MKKLSMKPADPRILIINGGSSSIKFALYDVSEPLKRGYYVSSHDEAVPPN